MKLVVNNQKQIRYHLPKKDTFRVNRRIAYPSSPDAVRLRENERQEKVLSDDGEG